MTKLDPTLHRCGGTTQLVVMLSPSITGTEQTTHEAAGRSSPVTRSDHQVLGRMVVGIVVTAVALEAEITTRTPSNHNEDDTVVCIPITSPALAMRLNRGVDIFAIDARVTVSETSRSRCCTVNLRRGRVSENDAVSVNGWVDVGGATGVTLAVTVLVGRGAMVSVAVRVGGGS